MSRRTRPHLPGSTFHLTSRLQRREALFVPEIRTALIGIVREQLTFSDVELLACAFMPNHLHFVILQRGTPLSRFMQPILRRTALLVQRYHGREGHVVERRYGHRACADPEHLRNAIVYTHLNPLRAGLCEQPEDYAWSSHAAWLGEPEACDGQPFPIALERALPIFATQPGRTRAELVSDYLAFFRWRAQSTEELSAADSACSSQLLAVRPETIQGDLNWMLHLTPRPSESDQFYTGPTLPAGVAPRPDLAAIARAVQQDAKLKLDLSLVRSRWGGPRYVAARNEIVKRACAAGYRGNQIARFLRITPAAVSRILAPDRRQRFGRPHV